MANERAQNESKSRGDRQRRAGLFVLFSAVLLIPKTLALRRRRAVWNALRMLAFILGGALATGELLAAKNAASEFSLARLLLGGVIVFLGVVIPPLKKSGSVDEKARELGALVVLNGGLYRSGNSKPVPVRFYIAPERLHVLDSDGRVALAIPVSEIAAVTVAGEGHDRALIIESRSGKTEFHYEGFFAEHLAEVARRTVDSRLRTQLKVLR
jgi:hypothetical protein